MGTPCNSANWISNFHRFGYKCDSFELIDISGKGFLKSSIRPIIEAVVFYGSRFHYQWSFGRLFHAKPIIELQLFAHGIYYQKQFSSKSNWQMNLPVLYRFIVQLWAQLNEMMNKKNANYPAHMHLVQLFSILFRSFHFAPLETPFITHYTQLIRHSLHHRSYDMGLR